MKSKMTLDDAVNKLVYKSHQDMYELCRKSHKEIYGIYGDQTLGRYRRRELVNWYILHNQWNEKTQRWQKNKLKDIAA